MLYQPSLCFHVYGQFQHFMIGSCGNVVLLDEVNREPRSAMLRASGQFTSMSDVALDSESQFILINKTVINYYGGVLFYGYFQFRAF